MPRQSRAQWRRMAAHAKCACALRVRACVRCHIGPRQFALYVRGAPHSGPARRSRSSHMPGARPDNPTPVGTPSRGPLRLSSQPTALRAAWGLPAASMGHGRFPALLFDPSRWPSSHAHARSYLIPLRCCSHNVDDTTESGWLDSRSAAVLHEEGRCMPTTMLRHRLKTPISLRVGAWPHRRTLCTHPCPPTSAVSA